MAKRKPALVNIGLPINNVPSFERVVLCEYALHALPFTQKTYALLF